MVNMFRSESSYHSKKQLLGAQRHLTSTLRKNVSIVMEQELRKELLQSNVKHVMEKESLSNSRGHHLESQSLRPSVHIAVARGLRIRRALNAMELSAFQSRSILILKFQLESTMVRSFA